MLRVNARLAASAPLLQGSVDSTELAVTLFIARVSKIARDGQEECLIRSLERRMSAPDLPDADRIGTLNCLRYLATHSKNSIIRRRARDFVEALPGANEISNAEVLSGIIAWILLAEVQGSVELDIVGATNQMLRSERVLLCFKAALWDFLYEILTQGGRARILSSSLL